MASRMKTERQIRKERKREFSRGDMVKEICNGSMVYFDLETVFIDTYHLALSLGCENMRLNKNKIETGLVSMFYRRELPFKIQRTFNFM